MNTNYSLLDLKGLVMESYHSGVDPDSIQGAGVKPLVNTAGFGLVTFISKYFDTILDICQSPMNMIAVLEGEKGNDFRKSKFASYKANRDVSKAKLDSVEVEQLKLAEALVKSFLMSQGVTLVGSKHCEGDDTIAYLVKNFPGITTVHTVDKDLTALCSDTCGVFIRGKMVTELNDRVTLKGERADLDVPPNLVTLYKSLCGDSSDGYGGVKGIGPAAWVNMVEEFGHDGLLELNDLIRDANKTQIVALGTIGNKHFKKIAEQFDTFRTMYDIADLHPEIVKPLWTCRVPDSKRVEAVFQQAKCLDLLDKYVDDCYTATLVTEDNYAGCMSRINELLEDTELVAWDYETTDTAKIPEFQKAVKGRQYVDMIHSEIAGCSFSFGRNSNHVFYFSVGHKDTRNISKFRVLEMIKTLENKGIEMVAQNCVQGDTEVLTKEGWVRIDQTNATQEIMQWDTASEDLSFVTPLSRTEGTSQTLLQWDTHNHKGSNTPEHRMVYSNPKKPEWLVKTAEQLKDMHGNSVHIPLSGFYEVSEPLDFTPDQVRLMEAIRADGSFALRGAYCRFHFSKKRKVTRILDLCSTLGVRTYCRKTKTGTFNVSLYSCPITQKIFKLIGKEKTYTLKLLDLSLDCKQALLDEAGHWDAHKGSKSSYTLTTINQDTADTLQTLAHTCGYRSSLNIRGNNRPEAGLTNSKDLCWLTIKKSTKCKLDAAGHKPKTLKGDFKVYCFTVPTGAFLVRRGGAIFVTGNCSFEATITKCQLDHTVKSWTDTKLYAHHIDENSENGLKSLSARYLNYKQISYADTLEAAGATDMSEISGQQVLNYGADDAVVTSHLLSLFTKITALEDTIDFINDYECPAVEVLVDSHIDGCNIDEEELKKQAAADDITIVETMKTIRELLEENCLQPNLKAAETLYADQRDYYKAKAKQLKGATVESVEGKVLDQKLKVKQGSFYEPLVQVPDCKDFLPTPTGFKAMAAAVGLPVYEKVTKAYNDQYLEECRSLELTPEQAEMLALIPPAWKSFKSREGEHYDKLKNFANNVIQREAGTKSTGTELNMGSPVQNQYLFYLLLDLPIRLRTRIQRGSVRDTYSLSGSPSTDIDAIESALANDCAEHPWKKKCLKAIQEHKSALTRRNIYWTPYPLWIAGDPDGLVHPGGSSCGTTTRRPTGSNPNLLQIAKGDVRRIFVPVDPDNVIVSIDFKSQELMVNADLCDDPTWMSAYTGESPKDLHAMTGCRILPTLINNQSEVKIDDIQIDGQGGCDYSFFKSHQDDDDPLGKLLKGARAIGKTVNFGNQYGTGAATLSRSLMVPEKDAGDYIEAYHKTFPMLQVWKNKIIAQAKVDGYVTTAYGSRRHCTGINSRDRAEASRWERQVINYKIQGTCADLLKVVLTNLSRTKILDATESFLISTVYDELLFEVPRDNLKELIHGVSKLMSVTMPGMRLEMIPDTSIGTNWADQTEVGVFPSQETIDEALDKL